MAEEWLADLLPRLTHDHPLAHQAAEVLRQGPPDPRAARLDAHHHLLQRHWNAVRTALAAFPDEVRSTFGPRPVPAPATGEDAPLDALALSLLHGLSRWPGPARQLAVALGRLVEDGPRLRASRRLPLGRGFEDLFDERLRRRFALLSGGVELLTALHRWRPLLLEEPAGGRAAIERTRGMPLGESERAWLEVERRVATLRFVRQNKTEDGHIRWYVRPDAEHDVALDRLGVEGYWAVCGPAGPAGLARLGTAVERVVGTGGDGWSLVALAPAGPDSPADAISASAGKAFSLSARLLEETDPLSMRRLVGQEFGPGLAERREHRLPATGATLALVAPTAPAESISPSRDGEKPYGGSPDEGARNARGASPLEGSRYRPQSFSRTALRFELDGRNQALHLWAVPPDGRPDLVACVPCQGTDDDLLDFLACLDRVADLVPPAEIPPTEFDDGPALAWARGLLRLRAADTRPARRVRLVYLPSSIPHQLGGVPEVGAAFLRDHLERLGDRVGVVKLRRKEFGRRLVELLGADVIGIGVYVHNRDEVAELVRRLRTAGFAGKVILGGPETRNIEAVQETVPGWDAIVRGEGEDVLPRVLEVLDLLGAGKWQAALDRAQALRGVALGHGDTVLLCDTAARNRAEVISCPLPFEWPGGGSRRLKMNFTRGCPYRCTFCPNHQGREFRSGDVDELWRYTVFAVADDLRLPGDVERAVAGVIQDRLGVAAPPRLRLALYLLGRGPVRGADLRAVVAALQPVIDARVWSDTRQMESLTGLRDTVGDVLQRLGDGPVLPWQAKAAWLLAKVAVLASRQLWRREGSHADMLEALRAQAPPPFVLETSEDNTLVNRKQITEYLGRRKAYGFSGDYVFNPGQNTVQDLLQGHDRDEANEEYIALLADENPFAVALGTDGPSNAILRQNQKPAYGVAGLLAVNRALGRHAGEVANNYILLTPETDFLEAVESFALFLLLPVPWRDYGDAINLRVIKEETTLATDEGLLFAPDDAGHHVPFRFQEVQRLLDRWGLTSDVPTDRLRPLLWQVLENDAEVRVALPLLVERWRRNFDNDAEIAALAGLVGQELCSAESVAHAFWRLSERVQREAMVDGRTKATFRDLLCPRREPCRDSPDRPGADCRAGRAVVR